MAGPQIIRPNANRKPLWAQVFPPTFNGLRAIHKIGWVHCDIHPGNILKANPKPRKIDEIVDQIADFGLAAPLLALRRTSLSLSDTPEMPHLLPGVKHDSIRRLN